MTFNPICSYFGGRKNTQSRDYQHHSTPCRGSSSNSFPAPDTGSLFGSRSPVMAVTIPSPDHLFTSKGSGYILRYHLPGGKRVGEGTAVTFSVFKTENRERACCVKIEMYFFGNLRTNSHNPTLYYYSSSVA